MDEHWTIIINYLHSLILFSVLTTRPWACNTEKINENRTIYCLLKNMHFSHQIMEMPASTTIMKLISVPKMYHCQMKCQKLIRTGNDMMDCMRQNINIQQSINYWAIFDGSTLIKLVIIVKSVKVCLVLFWISNFFSRHLGRIIS